MEKERRMKLSKVKVQEKEQRQVDKITFLGTFKTANGRNNIVKR